MQYFCSSADGNGFIHSIDNLIIEYVTIGSDGAIKRILTDIQEIGKKHEGHINYWERLNCKPCSKWSWCQHNVHLDDGIYISIGHYVNYAKPKVDFEVYPVVKLEVNPNKHAGKEVLTDLLEVLRVWGDDVTLCKYDYAVDIPMNPEDVEVFGSRKERGLYKGTRYFGQRNKNGYCKIYDKQKEQELDSPLTRVEHTIVCSGRKSTKSISFENVYFKREKKKSSFDDKKITPTDKVLIDFCNLCKANDLDYKSILEGLDKRKRWFITECLTESEYEKLEFDDDIREALLEKVYEYFGIKKKADIEVDEEGWVVLDDTPLPFD
ncbi:MAG: hypothetical protein J6K58_04775 [Lachnospiraceae bacterium]|nr:hypothetical protein [Lachnospiraceae bacterium]